MAYIEMLKMGVGETIETIETGRQESKEVRDAMIYTLRACYEILSTLKEIGYGEEELRYQREH